MKNCINCQEETNNLLIDEKGQKSPLCAPCEEKETYYRYKFTYINEDATNASS